MHLGTSAASAAAASLPPKAQQQQQQQEEAAAEGVSSAYACVPLRLPCTPKKRAPHAVLDILPALAATQHRHYHHQQPPPPPSPRHDWRPDGGGGGGGGGGDTPLASSGAAMGLSRNPSMLRTPTVPGSLDALAGPAVAISRPPLAPPPPSLSSTAVGLKRFGFHPTLLPLALIAVGLGGLLLRMLPDMRSTMHVALPLLPLLRPPPLTWAESVAAAAALAVLAVAAARLIAGSWAAVHVWLLPSVLPWHAEDGAEGRLVSPRRFLLPVTRDSGSNKCMPAALSTAAPQQKQLLRSVVVAAPDAGGAPMSASGHWTLAPLDVVVATSTSLRSPATMPLGSHRYDNGDRYEGEYQGGRPAGVGVYIFVATGGRYEGEWRDGKYDGHGIETWTRGSRYRGHYAQGLRSGFGVYRFYTGDVYAGQWLRGQSHGAGIQTCADGSRYAGEFAWGAKHGCGKYLFRNGDSYAGEYFADRMHGYGIYQFANGQRYEGAWHEGRKQGLGLYTFRNGETRAGYWHRGVLERRSSSSPRLPQSAPPSEGSPPSTPSSSAQAASPPPVSHQRVLHAVQEAWRAARHAEEVLRVDEQVSRSVAAGTRAAQLARAAGGRAVKLEESPGSRPVRREAHAQSR